MRRRSARSRAAPEAGATTRAAAPLPWWRVMRIAALLPPFASAFYSLGEPWARARVVLVWGLSKSLEASLLVAAGLGATLAGCIAVAWTGRRQRLAGCVHLGTGLVLAFVSWRAYTMVRDAGVRPLFIPIASVRPGRGLLAFAAAAAWLVVLGIAELVLDARQRWRRRCASAASSPGAG